MSARRPTGVADHRALPSGYTPRDSFEIGAWCLAFAVATLPFVIVGGLVLFYIVFVVPAGLPS